MINVQRKQQQQMLAQKQQQQQVQQGQAMNQAPQLTASVINQQTQPPQAAATDGSAIQQVNNTKLSTYGFTKGVFD